MSPMPAPVSSFTMSVNATSTVTSSPVLRPETVMAASPCTKVPDPLDGEASTPDQVAALSGDANGPGWVASANQVVRSWLKPASSPVVNVSTEVPDSRVYMIMQDDYLFGKAGADAIASLVPDGGRGVVMAGPANATWSKKRHVGFVDRVEEAYPNLEIIEAPNQLVDPEEGLADFMNVVAGNPEIDWIYAAHFALLLPITIPEEYADVPYVASDFTNFSQPWIHDGSADALFLVSPYWMGYVGLGTAVAVLNGQDVPRINCVPFPVVDQSNVDEDWVQIELIPEGWQAEVG